MFLLLLLLTTNSSASFDMQQDALCFQNKNFQGGSRILRFVANRKGACQGIAMLGKLLKENVEYNCEAPKDSRNAVLKKLGQATALSFRACLQKVVINGYCHTRHLCQDYKLALQSKALQLNYDLFKRTVLPAYNRPGGLSLSDYLNGTRDRTDLRKDLKVQQSNAKVLAKIRDALNNYNRPLLLYPHHVVLVTKMQFTPVSDTEQLVQLELYDSNRTDFAYKSFRVSSDWQRTIDAMPIHLVTPHKQVELRTCEVKP